MTLTVLAILTFVSIALTLANKALDIPSKILDITKKKLEIEQITSTLPKRTAQGAVEQSRSILPIRKYIGDALSAVAIVAVSYNLWTEYRSIEPLTRESVLNIGLLFSFAVFNLLSLFISRLERRLGRWIDNFLTALEETLELIKAIDHNARLRNQ
jgi:hypothetical protein